jgi:hypothetical protein
VYTVRTLAARPLFVHVAGSPASYTVRLEDAGPEDDGDTHATATALAVGQTAQGSLEVKGDADDFALSLDAGQRYVLEGSSTAVRFFVSGEDGTSVPLAADGSFTPKKAQTYFVEVREAAPTSYGPPLPYSFTLHSPRGREAFMRWG